MTEIQQNVANIVFWVGLIGLVLPGIIIGSFMMYGLIFYEVKCFLEERQDKLNRRHDRSK